MNLELTVSRSVWNEAFAAADETRRRELDQREAALITREAELNRRDSEISQTERDIVRSRDLDAP